MVLLACGPFRVRRYRYTIFEEDSASQVLNGHQNVVIEPPTIPIVTWTGSTQATFDIVAREDAVLPAGRYTVSMVGWAG